LFSRWSIKRIAQRVGPTDDSAISYSPVDKGALYTCVLDIGQVAVAEILATEALARIELFKMAWRSQYHCVYRGTGRTLLFCSFTLLDPIEASRTTNRQNNHCPITSSAVIGVLLRKADLSRLVLAKYVGHSQPMSADQRQKSARQIA
jgi:hypothetical protein